MAVAQLADASSPLPAGAEGADNTCNKLQTLLEEDYGRCLHHQMRQADGVQVVDGLSS
jgi:hypothetical protein